jgi:magnesium-dependent phosphatase 1
MRWCDVKLHSLLSCADSLLASSSSTVRPAREMGRKSADPSLPPDEARNREVTKLGVTFVLVRDGVNRQLFESGLDAWRKKLSHTT